MSLPLDDWPGSPAYVIVRLEGGRVERVAERGDLDEVRPWASVSKLAVGLAMGVESDWELHDLTEVVGPNSVNLANYLSHSSGLGLEEGDPVVPVATKRVYSNVGVDRAVAAVVGEGSPARWLDERVFRPLGMATTELVERPSSGVVGSTNDLVTMGEAWLRPDLVTRDTRDRLIRPYIPALEGIVPGFGRFSPCPWGLGPEVRGTKQHWMGDWPPASFGHFGQSGALLLMNAEERIAVAATSSVPFGAWARTLWPRFTSAARALALA